MKSQRFETNLSVLDPSRDQRLPGDVFVYRMPDGLYRFGRLLARGLGSSLESQLWADPVFHLVCFFEGSSLNKNSWPDLETTNYLIPPCLVNQKLWTLGYFKRIARIPLVRDELSNLCFKVNRLGLTKYYLIDGSEVSDPQLPCVDLSLHSFLTIDDSLSDALLIDRVVT
ncbi:hypothetical protein JIN77_16855 [Verrucomicrobiaceae bacterium R5-34]|nr:hypothetical protein [Verrucomicrobiaceae bacterium R5-34]